LESSLAGCPKTVERDINPKHAAPNLSFEMFIKDYLSELWSTPLKQHGYGSQVKLTNSNVKCNVFEWQFEMKLRNNTFFCEGPAWLAQEIVPFLPDRVLACSPAQG
jgi:hypothetical protein